MFHFSFENFLKPVESGIFREIPLDVPGKLFTSPMPAGAYDKGKKLLPLYKKYHVHHVFSLVTDKELDKKCRLSLLREYEKRGITFSRYIIEDYQAPSLDMIMALVNEAELRLMRGERLAIHCHAGVGRTSLAVACIVIALRGVPASKAVEYVRDHMIVNITSEQTQIIEKFEREYS